VPRVIVTQQAAIGLERCRRFLAAKNPQAAKRSAEAIGRHVALLETPPEIGRPFPDVEGFRELIIEFGESG